jgi:hypothetical protein
LVVTIHAFRAFRGEKAVSGAELVKYPLFWRVYTGVNFYSGQKPGFPELLGVF